MSYRGPCALVLPILLGPIGCASLDDDGDRIGDSRLESRSNNGMSLNGMSLNGMSLNGMSLNGMSLNGMSLNGMSLNGSQLSGTKSNGQPIAGAGLVGARMNGTLAGGGTLLLRIDSATALPFPNTDVWAYGVSYALAGGAWAPLCGTSGGAPVLAVPLAGTWSYASGVVGGGAWTASSSAFTFGCRGTALAKCVELGYKPWRSVNGTSLRDHHQACTRMLRADYCGNGTAGTINGWQVNLWDKVGIQADTESGSQWVFEGEWTPGGARCVDEYRALELVVSGDVPACALNKISHSCGGSSFAPGVLLKTEYNSSGVLDLPADLIQQTPSSPLADKVEDAMFALEDGFAALGEAPPAREPAVGHFEGAAGDLEIAIREGMLSAGYGNGLLSRVAGVSRFQATEAGAANTCQARDPAKLTASKQALAQGDALRSAGRYRDAISAFRDAVTLAEDASGRPCWP